MKDEGLEEIVKIIAKTNLKTINGQHTCLARIMRYISKYQDKRIKFLKANSSPTQTRE